MTPITRNEAMERRSVAGFVRDLVEEVGTYRSRLLRTRPAGPSPEQIDRYLSPTRVRPNQISSSGL